MDSSPNPYRTNRARLLVGAALTVMVAIWLALAAASPDRVRLWGDEGTFVAMTASLVRDGDLDFETADQTWVVQRQPQDPVTVILQKTARGISYSKPVLYALVAAPLYAVAGEAGMVVTNLVLLLAALGVTARFLRPVTVPGQRLWYLLTVLVGSVLLVYIDWKMSDLTLFSLTLIGLVLALGGRRVRLRRHPVRLPFRGLIAAIAGGLLLGAATSMRFTSAAVAAAVVLALMLERRWRRSFVVGLAAGLALLAIGGLTRVAVGTANPYKAVRSSFNAQTGYPTGDRTDETMQRFTTGRATQSASFKPPWQPRKTLYSILYFLFGRHTGIVLYFPVALVLLIHLMARPDRVALSLLAGVGAVIGFYLVWMPDNYFGGSTFVGNRYFLGVLPVFLVASPRPPGPRSLAVVWLLALSAWGSALVSVGAATDGPDSQGHAHAGVFRWLPFESTARRIDGLEERFWAGDYLRFLDPYARPSEWSFRLETDRPAAEILIATSWPGESLQFTVTPKDAELDIEVEDWRGSDRFPLPRQSAAAPGLIHVQTSTPWRRHPFWWNQRTYEVRVLRFSLSSTSGAAGGAVVRYAGRGRVLAPLAAELVEVAPDPSTVAASGTRSTLRVRLRNEGRRPWQVAGLFPVRIGYRFPSATEPRVAAGGTQALPRNVRPGEEISVNLTIRWPDRSGSFPLVLDLRRQPTGELGELGRLTLATLDVEVSPDSPAP